MKTKLKNCTEISEFTRRCLLNGTEEWRTEYTKEGKRVLEHWKNAKDVDEFKNLIFADKSLHETQGYAMLSRETVGHWYRVREMFGNKCFKIEADAGNVLVRGKDRSFSVTIPNGYGDGTIRCAVFTYGEPFNHDMMNPTGMTVQGEMDIMEYDCDIDSFVAKSISGRYHIYTLEGLVAFQEWKRWDECE